MIVLSRMILLAAASLLAACATTPPPAAPAGGPAKEAVQPADNAADPGEYKAMTFGRGIARAEGSEVSFQYSVSVYIDDRVEGTFVYAAETPSGTIDLAGEVSCTTLDHELGRAWIGGALTRNDSTDPRYTAAPGSEAMFRVLDRNREQMQPLITLPRLAGRGGNATRFCNAAEWDERGLYLVEPGALAIFP